MRQPVYISTTLGCTLAGTRFIVCSFRKLSLHFISEMAAWTLKCCGVALVTCCNPCIYQQLELALGRDLQHSEEFFVAHLHNFSFSFCSEMAFRYTNRCGVAPVTCVNPCKYQQLGPGQWGRPPAFTRCSLSVLPPSPLSLLPLFPPLLSAPLPSFPSKRCGVALVIGVGRHIMVLLLVVGFVRWQRDE